MTDPIASLRLDHTTSQEQLQAFLAKGDSTTKVRAQTNSDGSVTLFSTDRATGWWGQMTGLSKERETARAALDLWFRFQFGPDLSPEARQVLDSRIGAGKVNVGAVRELMAGVGRLEEPPPKAPYKAILPRDGVIRESGDGKRALTLGGSDYVMGAHLGDGGQGTVREGVSETGEKVAVKFPKEKNRHEDVEVEFRAHERALGAGRDVSHIVGLKGAVMDSEGRIEAIVLEHMPGGDAGELLGRLDDAESRGLIEPEEARLVRLTMAKDMATGLAQIHEGSSLVHFDVKPDNFLVGGDGVVKISDFGTVRSEEEMHGRTLTSQGGSLRYTSPEHASAEPRIKKLDNEIERLEMQARKRGFTKEALTYLAPPQKLRREIDRMSVDSKTDVFSLGLCLANAFEGTDLTGGAGLAKNRGALGSGAGTESRKAMLEKLRITSDSPEHELIRTMLAGDPKDRPTAREVAESQLFADPEIGSEKTRKLLLSIAKGELKPPPDGRQQ